MNDFRRVGADTSKLEACRAVAVRIPNEFIEGSFNAVKLEAVASIESAGVEGLEGRPHLTGEHF
jgi:hypothetical protein